MTEIVKLAIGEIVLCHPLDGEMYGSDGEIMQLLAIGVLGGNENTDHLVLSTRAVAIPSRSVDMAAISPPSISDQEMAPINRVHGLEGCCPFCKVMADSRRSLRLRLMALDVIAKCRLRS